MTIATTQALNFKDRVNNFFDNCNNPSVATGKVNGDNGVQTNNYDHRELVHQIEKLQLEVQLLKFQKEKAEAEANYWQQFSKK